MEYSDRNLGDRCCAKLPATHLWERFDLGVRGDLAGLVHLK